MPAMVTCRASSLLPMQGCTFHRIIKDFVLQVGSPARRQRCACAWLCLSCRLCSPSPLCLLPSALPALCHQGSKGQ